MIGEDKVRILITIKKEMKTELEHVANNQNRTVSNLTATIIKEYLEKYKSD